MNTTLYAAMHLDPRIPVGAAAVLVLGGAALGGLLTDWFKEIVARRRGYERVWIPIDDRDGTKEVKPR